MAAEDSSARSAAHGGPRRSTRYFAQFSLRHRVLLTFEAEADGVRSEDLIDEIFGAVATP